MRPAASPRISVIVPVFNTGAFLDEAVDSVLNQVGTAKCAVPAFELILVDDASTDPLTLQALERISGADPRVVVVRNTRGKGAAGARNTGILHASGEWLAFLDSDDIWTPTSLALRWEVVSANPGVQWLAGRFRFLKPDAGGAGKKAVFESRESLWTRFDTERRSAGVTRLATPVDEFTKSCFIGIISVLIRRDLAIRKGMFNESLRRAEDYYLWFRCAFDTDLWLIESDVSFYRIRADSLTHGDAPRHLCEDQMVELLLASTDATVHRQAYLKRFDLVMQDFCYFYRDKKQFRLAFGTALRWLRKRPHKPAAWRELTACCLRAG
ncbi:MAG: hypothetical protein JWQ88_1895 [Rhodoferax sp.]|nr:hypothetical protein [Rhodoferax sp.]